MFIALWIALILLGLIYKKSKKLAYIQILFITIMFAINDGNPDQYDYILSFNRVNSSFEAIFSGNILYNILMRIFGVFNNYNVAIFFVTLFALVILYKGITFYTDKISLVLALYLIAPLTIDATQVKNFIAMCIWIYISRYLYQSYERKNISKEIFKYLVGVFLCTLVHFSFVFTLVYSLVPFVEKKYTFRYVIAFVSVIILVSLYYNVDSIVVFLNRFDIPTLNLITAKYTAYLSNYVVERGNTRIFISCIFYIIVFLMFYLKKIMKISRSEEETKYISFIFKITLLSMFILPLISFSIEIYRMQRNLLCMYYIMIGMQHARTSRFAVNRLTINSNRLSFLFVILLSSFYFYIETILWNFEAVFRVLFKI